MNKNISFVNKSQCNHFHLFHPFCDNYATLKKILSIFFHIFTLGIPLFIYKICFVRSSDLPKALPNHAQNTIHLKSNSCNEDSNPTEQTKLVQEPVFEQKTSKQETEIQGACLLLMNNGQLHVTDKGEHKNDSYSFTQGPSLKDRVAVYVSCTCNPAHKGHILLAETAIRELEKTGKKVHDVFFSIASDNYVQSKIQRAHLEAKKAGKTSKKFAVAFEDRERMLQWTIHHFVTKNGFFKDAERIFFWDDRQHCDHPYAYAHLAENYKEVYLAAGMDNCNSDSLQNWRSYQVNKAIVVRRKDGETLETAKYQERPDQERFYVDFPEEFAKDCENLSSSAIQEQTNNKHLEPEVLHEFFESLRPE